jgi:hypothetical protein
MLLKRKLFTSSGVLGELFTNDEKKFCDTLEPSEVKILPGIYMLKKYFSPRLKIDVFHITNGDKLWNNRYLEIHSGNSSKDTNGCILVGKRVDNLIYVTESKRTLKLLFDLLEERNDYTLTVLDNGDPLKITAKIK